MVQKSGKYEGSGGHVAGRFSAICVVLAACALICGCTISFRYVNDTWDTLPQPPYTGGATPLVTTAETTDEETTTSPSAETTSAETTSAQTTSTVRDTEVTRPPVVTTEDTADDPERLTTRPLHTDTTEPITTDTEPLQTTEASPRLEAREAVDAAYFSDALFLGDSRTVGLSLYSGLRSNYYSQQGLNVSTVTSSAFIAVGDEKWTLSQALETNNTFKKVYISFGINEIGWPKTDSFIASYTKLVDLVMEKLPDAAIYIQEILPMSKATAETKRYADMGGNAKVAEYNGRLLQLCEEKGAYYVALTEIFADENGDLNVTDSFDGIHLGVKSCKAWIEYLKTHTIP